MKNELTIQILDIEYQSWVSNYGKGRNEDDLRFGQYIHNNFLVLPEGNQIDGYYTEMPETAYHVIANLMSGYG
jgi:hypothetical protein